MPRRFLCNRWNLLLLAAALAPLALQADVVFTNVTSPADVNSESPVCVGNPNCPNPRNGFSDAEAFTPGADFTLTDAQMLVSANSGDPYFNVFLYTNANGTPGSAIEQIGFSVAATTPGDGSLITADSIATPITLTSGTEYWLVLKPADAGSFVDWSNGGSPSVPFATSDAAGTVWSASGTATDQFQIDGTPITTTPEPSTLPLASVSVFGLLIAARRAVRAR